MNKKNLFILITMLVLLALIPAGLYLIKKTQIFKGRAEDVPLNSFVITQGGKTLNCTQDSPSAAINCNADSTDNINIKLKPDGAVSLLNFK